MAKEQRATNFIETFPHWTEAKLVNRQQEVIERFFGLNGNPETLANIAESLGLTRQRVGAIKNQALARIVKYHLNRERFGLLAS